MVGACLMVLRDAVPDRLRGTPVHETIDEAVAAAASQVVGGEAQPEPVVRVVGQLEVRGQVLPAERPGPDGVRLQQDGRLGARIRFGPSMSRASVVCSTVTR